MLRVFFPPILALALYVLPFRCTHSHLLRLAFGFWLAGGLSLLISGGIRLGHATFPIDLSVVIIAIVVAVVLGIVKGRLILSKTSARNIERIAELPEFSRAVQVYSLRSWIVIEVMLFISASMTWMAVDPFWRGVVNLAVGFALVSSSLNYLPVLNRNPATQSGN